MPEATPTSTIINMTIVEEEQKRKTRALHIRVTGENVEEEVKEQMKHHQESRHEPEPSEEDRTELPEEFDTAL